MLVLAVESDGALDEVGDRLDAGPLGFRDRPGCVVPGGTLRRLQADQEGPAAIGETLQPFELTRLEGVGLLLEEIEDGQTRLVVGVEGGFERGRRQLHGALGPDPFALRASASDFSTAIRSEAMF